MDISEFIALMEKIAPPELAEDFDENRIGLIIEGKSEVDNIACALDATEFTIAKTADLGCDMLVVHHTPIWNGLTRINGRSASIIKKALISGVNIYAMHTNFDHAEGGINDALSGLLGLTNISSMSLGVVGDCGLDLNGISERLNGSLRVYGNPEDVSRLAVAGGSGFDLSLINEAYELGADAFLSSELKHNVMLESPLPLIESTHYDLESPGMKFLAGRMGWEFIDEKPDICIY
ncbi:Nif3-like dinuclear metal center hexameric protein [Methanoplanus endosymbiosus]|uniref:Nif3-like dinuclear metal center hexameric protein n=1 Tax=Methanoplanus endosymbiosus TaxID=33865 RepID=A0A9E7TKR0_9EURY|nr:Nif3-like dinuclear metal center hexameric protein [Methanoplanus endosymbiosus]UUX92895.1 Nif3-like dinuclear metal center hexameric protein [Methanoplanus endosymbiosus]